MTKTLLEQVKTKLDNNEAFNDEEKAFLKTLFDQFSLAVAERVESFVKEIKVTMGVYKIKPNDTLFSIAYRFTGNGDNYFELLEVNSSIKNKHLIFANDVLMLPPKWLTKPDVIKYLTSGSV